MVTKANEYVDLHMEVRALKHMLWLLNQTLDEGEVVYIAGKILQIHTHRDFLEKSCTPEQWQAAIWGEMDGGGPCWHRTRKNVAVHG